MAPWPEPRGWRGDNAARDFARIQAVVSTARTLRAEYGVTASKRAPLHVAAADPDVREVLARHADDISRLALASETVIAGTPDEPGWARQVVEGGIEVAVRLADLVDMDRELARLTEEAERAESLLAAARVRLADERFVSRAPAEIVERERSKAADLERAIERLEALRSGLTG
jgi:valyl-tRNA synthetase